MSQIALGELFFGARNSQRVDDNLARVERFLPIPVNDLWIAATALEHDLTLATRDGHFDAIDSLKRERW